MRWTTRHDQILSMHKQGITNVEISKKLKLTQTTISRIINTPDFKERLIASEAQDIARKEVEDRLESMILAEGMTLDDAIQKLLDAVPTAVNTLIKLSQTGESKDRLKMDACKEILDRAGLKPPEVVETRNREYTPEEIEQAGKTAKELLDITQRLTNTESRFVMKISDGGSSTDDSSDPTTDKTSPD